VGNLPLGQLVLMDDFALVRHPRGSGYDHGEAGKEAEGFSQQLSAEELRNYREILNVARSRIRQ